MALALLVLGIAFSVWADASEEPIPVGTPRGPLVPPGPMESAPMPPPSRLRAQAVDAAFDRRDFPRAMGLATVTIVGEEDQAPDWIVAVLDGQSRAMLSSQKIGGRDLPTTVELEAPEQDHWVVLATSEDTARFFYLSQHPLAMEWDGERLCGSSEFDTALHEVSIELEWQDDDDLLPPAVLPQLSRVGDAGWRYRPAGAQPLYERGQPLVFPGLGVGHYELQLDGARVEEDRDLLRFEVPVASPIKIRCRHM